MKEHAMELSKAPRMERTGKSKGLTKKANTWWRCIPTTVPWSSLREGRSTRKTHDREKRLGAIEQMEFRETVTDTFAPAMAGASALAALAVDHSMASAVEHSPLAPILPRHLSAAPPMANPVLPPILPPNPDAMLASEVAFSNATF